MHKLNNVMVAAVLYKEYVSECEVREPGNKGELCRAYKFLAIHCLRIRELTDAYHYAQKCLAYEEVSLDVLKKHQLLLVSNQYFIVCFVYRQKKKQSHC